MLCPSVRGIHSGHPWPSPFGRPSAVQNGCPGGTRGDIPEHIRVLCPSGACGGTDRSWRSVEQGFEPHHPSPPYTKKPGSCRVFLYMAVREGFEPSIPFGIHTFQACAFSHSATSPIKSSFLCSYFIVLGWRHPPACALPPLRALPSAQPLGHLTNKIVFPVLLLYRTWMEAPASVRVTAPSGVAFGSATRPPHQISRNHGLREGA